MHLSFTQEEEELLKRISKASDVLDPIFNVTVVAVVACLANIVGIFIIPSYAETVRSLVRGNTVDVLDGDWLWRILAVFVTLWGIAILAVLPNVRMRKQRLELLLGSDEIFTVLSDYAQVVCKGRRIGLEPFRIRFHRSLVHAQKLRLARSHLKESTKRL